MTRSVKEKLFSNEFKVTIINNAVPEYYAKLSDLHAQFRRIGANYNQVIATLRTHFSERKAMAMLYKLENETRNLVIEQKKISELCKRYEQEWLQK